MRKILRAEVVRKCSAWISTMTGEGWLLAALLMTSEASSVSEQHRKIHCIAYGVGNSGDSVGAAQNGDCHSDRIAGWVLVTLLLKMLCHLWGEWTLTCMTLGGWER